MTSVDFLKTRLPLVSAPMAGGPSTVELAKAVSAAGAFAFLAGGYKSPEALQAEIRELAITTQDFGVNLFVPNKTVVDPKSFENYLAELRPEAELYGLVLEPEPITDDDFWQEKLELLLAEPVAMVSFTFGLPTRAEILELQKVGSKVLATVTTLAEAELAKDRGVDGLVVQGSRAGGHSATFDPLRKIEPVATEALVQELASKNALPIIAAGGVDSAQAVTKLIEAGATAVAVGTLFLKALEAGTSATHRAALADPNFTQTTITHVFTGRPARALQNGFIIRHQNTAPFFYPALHHLTRSIRQAAAKSGDPDNLHLWAGTGWRNSKELSAAEIVAELTSEL